MIQIVSPAPFWEARALALAGLPHKPQLRQAIVLQLSRAVTFGLVHEGRLLVVIGYWPVAEDAAEVFLFFAPKADVAPHLTALARAAHLTLLARAQDGVACFRALVRSGYRPGERMARLAGFSPVGPSDEAPGFTVWEGRYG